MGKQLVGIRQENDSLRKNVEKKDEELFVLYADRATTVVEANHAANKESKQLQTELNFKVSFSIDDH